MSFCLNETEKSEVLKYHREIDKAVVDLYSEIAITVFKKKKNTQLQNPGGGIF